MRPLDSDGLVVRHLSPPLAGGSDKAQRLEHRLLDLAIEDRVHVLQHLSAHVEKAPLVLDGDESPIGAVVHGYLEGLHHRADRLDPKIWAPAPASATRCCCSFLASGANLTVPVGGLLNYCHREAA